MNESYQQLTIESWIFLVLFSFSHSIWRYIKQNMARKLGVEQSAARLPTVISRSDAENGGGETTLTSDVKKALANNIKPYLSYPIYNTL